MIQHPIYPLIIACFTLFLVIIESIQSEKVLKNRMILAFFNIALSVMAFVLYASFILKNATYQTIYIGFNFFVYFVFLIILYSTFKTSTLKANHYQIFIKSIKNTQWNVYYVVDKKERIKDMSSTLLHELNMEKEDVIGKKLFTVFNQSIRFVKRNNQEINNRQLDVYYQTYKDTLKIGDQEIEELLLMNATGQPVLFKMVNQPVYVLGKYKGRMSVGEKKSNFDLLEVEKALNHTNNELESIRHKFIATLELSDEGLFFIDLDERSIWFNDACVKHLGLPGNTLDLTDYRRQIDAEDLKKYLAALGDLTPTQTTYQASYRILVKGRYLWFKEKGKRLFEDLKGSIIMGTLNPIANRHFMSSNIDILDGIKDQHDLLVSMNKLFKNGRYFQLMLIELKNIPKINEDHGRDVGNMMMAEYIKKLKSSFVSESGDIFRMSGLVFGVTITDPRKMELIINGVKSNPTFLNLSMQYGSLSVDLEVFAGIAIGGSDAHQELELYDAAKKALKMAFNPQFTNHCCYYKDLDL